VVVVDIWSKEFPGRPECLAEARRFTYAVLGDLEVAHTVALVTDELAANAIKHSASGKPGGEFVVKLALLGDRCLVRVDDQGGPKTPSLCVADDEDEAGRGLSIVSQLASGWGIDGDERARSVWAEIRLKAVRGDV
jgi:two-component sensor histidine kinase